MTKPCVYHASHGVRIAPFVVANCSNIYNPNCGACAARVNVSQARSRALFARLLFALLFVTVSAAYLGAQTSGSISGHIADATGAVIPNAAITLSNVAEGTSRSTATTGAGDYSFPDVPPGVYKIQVKCPGFKTTESSSFQLDVQQSMRQDFTMAIGVVTQSVTVEATGTLLQVENATLGAVVENAAINEMPLNGIINLSLVALSSDVNTLSSASGQAGSRLGGDRASQAISVGGQRIMFDDHTLDGLSYTRSGFQYAYWSVAPGMQTSLTQQTTRILNELATRHCSSLAGGIRNERVSWLDVRFHPQQHRDGKSLLLFHLHLWCSSHGDAFQVE